MSNTQNLSVQDSAETGWLRSLMAVDDLTPEEALDRLRLSMAAVAPVAMDRTPKPEAVVKAHP